MNKKLFLILLILPLISFFSGWIHDLIIPGEPWSDLVFFIFDLIKLIIICVIEIIIFLIFKKLLSRRLNDYKLASIICVITFLLLFFIGGFNDFLFVTAYSLKNFSFCYAINNNFYSTFFSPFSSTDEKNDCIFRVAIKKGDASICEKKLEGSMRENCYSGVAATKKDPNLCEKINNIEDRDWCYFGVAIRTKNLDICEKILNQDTKKFCDTAYNNTKQ